MHVHGAGQGGSGAGHETAKKQAKKLGKAGPSDDAIQGASVASAGSSCQHARDSGQRTPESEAAGEGGVEADQNGHEKDAGRHWGAQHWRPHGSRICHGDGTTLSLETTEAAEEE